MFYSNDLLGKKSPLGAIWIAAHGKKLNKGRILQVNVAESCKHIMDPEVPHALRLQAILVGGIVIIYNKQQGFLLEDCNEMLRRIRSLSETTTQGATLEKKKNRARAEAITMPTEDMLGEFNMNDLFPTFSSQLLSGPEASQAPQISDGEDLFVMPTLPEGDTPGRGGRGTAGYIRLSLDGLERFDLNMMDQPETFEVPDINLDLPGMEMVEMQAPSSAHHLAEGNAEELFCVPEDLLEDGNAEQPRSQTPQPSDGKGTSSGGATRTQQRKARGKKLSKPIVDVGDEVQIRGKVYREWMLDRSDLMVPRPQQRAALSQKSPIIIGPATAESMGNPWPAELMEIFNRNATLSTTISRPRASATAGGEEDLLEEQEGQLDGMLHPQGADFAAEPEYGDMAFDPVQGWMDEEGAAQAANPFRRHGGRRAASEATDDIETERLRAALNNTPGSAVDAFYLNQMGLTPASSDPLLATNLLTSKNKRNRSSLRPDSEGMLSERSSDPRGAANRLSDLGGDLDGDMAAMLPVVGEDEPLELGMPPASRKRQRLGMGSEGGSGSAPQGLTAGTGTYGTVSQFELLEESGPGTQAVGAAESMNRSTMALIGLLRGKFDQLESQGAGRNDISLFEMAARLTRGEAAKLFAQILVTRSADFVKAQQDEPFGDILITRGPFL